MGEDGVPAVAGEGDACHVTDKNMYNNVRQKCCQNFHELACPTLAMVGYDSDSKNEIKTEIVVCTRRYKASLLIRRCRFNTLYVAINRCNGYKIKNGQ